MSNLNNNTTQLELLLAKVNELPEAGGTNTSDATATTSDILSGKTAYVDGEKITGTIETVTQATPSVSIDSAGKITATATQSAGYVPAGTKTGTKQLSTQSGKTITPNTTTQTAVASGVYTTGEVRVGPIPSNYITPSGTKEITTNGTHDVKTYASATVNVASGGGEDVEDETTAYTNKLATLETAISALETELQGKASSGGGNDTNMYDYSTVTFYVEGTPPEGAILIYQGITEYEEGPEDNPMITIYDEMRCVSLSDITNGFSDTVAKGSNIFVSFPSDSWVNIYGDTTLGYIPLNMQQDQIGTFTRIIDTTEIYIECY